MKNEFDIIIIGAGHNGLTLGAYLARSNLDVVVLERRHEEGGGLATEELTQPGFLHNTHANYHTFVDLAPPINDLELVSHGVEYVKPAVQMASIYPDQTCLLIHDDLDRTVESIAQLSPNDAQTFKRLYKEAHRFVNLLLNTLMYEPPLSIKELTKALSVFDVSSHSEFLNVKLRTWTISDFLNAHFTDPKVKAHLGFHAAVCGYVTDKRGLAIGFPLLVGKIDNWHLSKGGSHKVAHALWRDLANHGGLLITDAEVASIIVKDNIATGVKLSDGGQIFARKAVVSTVSVEQTFGQFLNQSDLPAELLEELKTITHQPYSLFSVHLALKDKPDYTAKKHDPEVNNAWVVNLGYSSLEQLNSDWSLIRAGHVPEPCPNVAVNTIYDPTDAPEGYFTGLIRQFVPFNVNQTGSGTWRYLSSHYGNKLISKWAEFAPNISEAVIDYVTYSPLDIAEKLVNMVNGDWMMGEVALENMLDQRPTKLLGNYKTPVSGLYMGGSTQHPHGFITFAPAYNALSVIAADLNIDPWWREV